MIFSIWASDIKRVIKEYKKQSVRWIFGLFFIFLRNNLRKPQIKDTIVDRKA